MRRRDPLTVRRRALPALIVALTVLAAAGCAGGGAGRTSSTHASGTAAPEGVHTTTIAVSTTAPPSTTQPPEKASSTTIPATAGSPDSGDPYFPSLGNGGYDVQNYDISLNIDPVSGRIAGTEVMAAVALQDLSALYLDLQGLDVTDLRVDGRTASFRQEGQELRITCPAAVAKGARFVVATAYSGVPAPISTKLYIMGWQKTGDTILTLDEPQGASSWFPVNDTPADKATYTFRLTVPAPYTATANGVLVGNEPAETGRTFTWNMDEPMASYLAAVDVGEFSSETSTSPGGVAIRNYFATDLASAAHVAFSRTGDVIDYFAALFGPYPFPVYGVVVPDADSGAAMENQTLSLFGRDVVTKKMATATSGAIFLSHELAHQWFGDSVTIEHWDDIWLSEGFATYASWLWLEHDLGRQALDDQVALSQDLLGKTLEAPPGTPGADHMFGVSVYRRGALTLHALRLTVGDDSFFRTLRAWADRYKYGNADTPEFIALAKEEAPQVPAAQLDALFQAWLYGAELPALPSAAVAPGSGQ